MIEQGVGGHFSAAHRDENGKLHGHTWEVVAWRLGDDACALGFQDTLNSALAQLDHTELPEGLQRGGQLAQWIGVRANATRVEVMRRVEKIYATWTA